MITLCLKLHKCPYTGQPSNFVVLDNEINPDYLRYFISQDAVNKYYSNLHYRWLVKIPVESRSKEIMDDLAKLENPLYLVLNESSGADVAQRVKFAQEIINLCMPTAAKTVAFFAIQQYQTDKTTKEFDAIKEKLWDLFVENTNQRLALKKKKFKMVAVLEKDKLKQIYEFFFKLTEKLYRDFIAACNVQKKKVTAVKGPKDPFTEEHKAFEPFQRGATFIAKVKNEKATVPVRSPYATSVGSEKFVEKKYYEYEIPKSVPDLGFNHFRELGKVMKSDFSLNLDFTQNAQNVTNTTFFVLLESLPKFDSLRSLSIDISRSQNFGAVGFGYLRSGLLNVQLESFCLKTNGCQPMNDACVDQSIKGLDKSPNLKNFYLYASNCPALTDNSLALISRLAKNHKTLKKLTIDFSRNNSITDTGVQALRKVLEELRNLSHLELNFDKCENVSKKAKESIRFFIRSFPNIGSYKLT